ncbi:PH domain-containing protein [Alkalicoccobacillus murimartini]|uniref:PH domain-containing protein n=1 Tax=Alkalicoccobacillus murimartini TaxID=171685 RepID=UPI0027D842D7|nr:PH domain-containing protein [Alkalicoccobacillus murimartini]
MYKTSFDKKFIIFLTLFLLTAVTAFIYTFFDDSPRGLFFRTIGIPIVGIGVPMIIRKIPKISYNLNDDHLLIKTGVKDFIVKYETMNTVHSTSSSIKNIAKSANSFGLRVNTNFSEGVTIILKDDKRPFVQITPKDKEQFIKELQEKVPNLTRSQEPF